jgi:hypothetical protein
MEAAVGPSEEGSFVRERQFLGELRHAFNPRHAVLRVEVLEKGKPVAYVAAIPFDLVDPPEKFNVIPTHTSIVT